MRRLFLLILLCVSLTGVLSAAAQDDRLTVMATTTLLADVARNVAGDLLNVESLLPADADTHAYEPTTDDAARLARADLLLTVGLGYETFIEALLDNVGGGVPEVHVSDGIAVLPFADHAHDDEHAEETAEGGDEHEDEHAHGPEPIGIAGIDDIECDAHDHEEEAAAKRFKPAFQEDDHDDHEHGACDPHVWMNPLNVAIWASNIAEAFAELDPANAEAYRANAAAYAEALTALDAEIEALIDTALPDEADRVLITNHEFLGYFAARYHFEVAATVLPGSATATGEVDAQTLAALIEQVRAEAVPAIFAEVSANPQVAELVAQESGVAVVTALYSESLSAADGPAATYLDFLRYNAETIVAALTSAG